MTYADALVLEEQFKPVTSLRIALKRFAKWCRNYIFGSIDVIILSRAD